MIDNSLLMQKAVDEIQNRNIWFTREFLKVHSLEYVNDIPVVLKIDKNRADNKIFIYIKVVDEKFYFILYFSQNGELQGADTEPYISIFLKTFSKVLSVDELGELSTLKRTHEQNWRSKVVMGKKIECNESAVIYEPFKEPDDFEYKLEKVIDYLETDKEGVLRLSEKADAWIGIVIEYYIGNTMLGGPQISKDIIKRVANLNLEFNFDLYVSGTSF